MSIAHVEQPKKRRRAALGPHTRQHRLLEGLDWRTREGQVLIAARAELTAHVCGNPNNVQKALEKRLILIEVDKWISLEEASHQTQLLRLGLLAPRQHPAIRLHGPL
jgi:hypothetical protein